MDIQTEIEWSMRPHIFDFLIDTHAAFGLLPDTLYLAVNLLDRYCSKRVVYRRHYQLVACASLLIASKYGDRKERVPTIKELKGMCCGLYQDVMYTQMEWHILITLDWAIGHPTIDSFLQIVLSDAPYDPEIEHMAWYLCETALFHREFASIRPSVMARSAVELARQILGRPQQHQYQSDWSGRYDYGVVVDLFNQLYNPSRIVYQKYAASQFSSVSRTVAAFVERQRAARQPAPPTPAPVELPRLTMSLPATSMPQTPNKLHYPPLSQHGYMTPPITPDSEGYLAVNAAEDKPAYSLPMLCPVASTSPSKHQTGPQSSYYPPSHGLTSTIQPQYYLQ